MPLLCLSLCTWSNLIAVAHAKCEPVSSKGLEGLSDTFNRLHCEKCQTCGLSAHTLYVPWKLKTFCAYWRLISLVADGSGNKLGTVGRSLSQCVVGRTPSANNVTDVDRREGQDTGVTQILKMRFLLFPGVWERSHLTGVFLAAAVIPDQGLALVRDAQTKSLN